MKNFGLSMANWKSLFIHFLIILASSLLIVLPELQEVLVTNGANPEIVALCILFGGTIIKKLLDEK